MKTLTAAWVKKAEADYRAARKLAHGNDPLHDQVCFFCQQAAEMLKMASALDAKGLRDYALAKATSTDNSHPKCSK